MARFAFAAFLVAATFVSATPALSQQELEQPSAPGGLGNTRSDLDLVYGAVERTNVTDSGDYAVDAVSYADEWVFYLIEDGTTPSPDDRAFIITGTPTRLTVGPTRSDRGRESASPRRRGAHERSGAIRTQWAVFKPGTVLEYRQTFYSESIARLFPNPELYRGG